jgi:hypothetical protein
MKKRNIWLLGIILVIFFIGLVLAIVSNRFNSQVPADINIFNLFGVSPTGDTRLNISYNISDANLVTSSIKLYHKVNSSTSDADFFFVNGTSVFSGFGERNYSSNYSDVFSFLLSDNRIYPATYNYNQTYMENASKSVYDNDLNTEYVKIQLLNVSNVKNFSFFEIYADNQTSASLSLRIYYCNSSYANQNPAATSVCTNFYNMPASESFNHTHSVFSKHHVLSFPINITNKQIGSVYVTGTSYFLLRGRLGVNGWNVYYITNISRPDAIQTTQNSGGAWVNLNGTVDAHLHQYDGTETLWYYACANNTLNEINCTALRSDLLETGGLPPISPGIYNPINKSYNGNISINYTASFSPNLYPIIIYNITLQNYSDNRIAVITVNNSLNLSYLWNSLGTPDGIYNFHVSACDSNYLCSIGESDDFTIDNTNPTAALLCNPQPVVYVGDVLTCSCDGSDATSGVNSTSFIEHPSTSSAGTFQTDCLVTDNAGNSVIDTFTYLVESQSFPVSPSGNSPGSSTPPSETPVASVPPSENTNGGENKTLKINENINIVVEKNNYTLNVLEIKENSVKINFSYDGIEREMTIGEEINYNIGESIVTIKLERIEKQEAIFNVLLSKKPSNLNYQIIAVIISSILALISLGLILINLVNKYKKYKRKDILKHNIKKSKRRK